MKEFCISETGLRPTGRYPSIRRNLRYTRSVSVMFQGYNTPSRALAGLKRLDECSTVLALCFLLQPSWCSTFNNWSNETNSLHWEMRVVTFPLSLSLHSILYRLEAVLPLWGTQSYDVISIMLRMAGLAAYDHAFRFIRKVRSRKVSPIIFR